MTILQLDTRIFAWNAAGPSLHMIHTLQEKKKKKKTIKLFF